MISGGRTMAKTVAGLRSVPLTAEQRSMLVQCRKELGLSQRDLAEKVGVYKLTIYNVESGTCRPTPILLAQLCRAVGLEFDLELRVELRRKQLRKKRRAT